MEEVEERKPLKALGYLLSVHTTRRASGERINMVYLGIVIGTLPYVASSKQPNRCTDELTTIRKTPLLILMDFLQTLVQKKRHVYF